MRYGVDGDTESVLDTEDGAHDPSSPGRPYSRFGLSENRLARHDAEYERSRSGSAVRFSPAPAAFSHTFPWSIADRISSLHHGAKAN